MKQATLEELQEMWPEGWLGRRYTLGANNKKRVSDYAYVVPRRAQNTFEITRAASYTRLGDDRLQVVWYWGDPAELMIEPLDSKERA